MSELLRNIDLPISRFEAIDGWKIPTVSMVCKSDTLPDKSIESYFRKRLHRETLFNPTQCYNNSVTVYDLDAENKWKWQNSGLLGPLQIACWQSHLQIYFDMVSDDPKAPVLILEDDVEVPKNFKKLALDVLQRVPSDWEIFFFGFRDYPRTVGVVNGFAKLKFVVNAHAYAIRNAQVAKKLISLANTKHVQIADRIWQEAIFNASLIAYCPGDKMEIVPQNKTKYGSTFS